ncbi:MAG TPA: fused MFS/spermidine synthase [Candidatus Limnocylindrales bacterium]|jgi:spermidine synthase|nr:fused MFS/spermidine synthase [Candidatus Limnocylindrales bacterium]
MRRTTPIYAIFVLSGAAGLIYEIVWARQLVLVFGNTTQAVSAILTGFFGGMAIGSFVGGRLADRVRSPLRLYGLLELALVAVVLATPITFELLHEVYRGGYAALREQPHFLALLRFALALAALGPATVMMGITLPALTRYLTTGDAHLSVAFGRLYAANTIGAIVGTLASGFVLIEVFGLTGALIVGVTCSAIAGAIALLLAARRRGAAAEPERPARREVAGRPGARPTLALAIAFVSGLTSLGYQVLWTRLLAAGTGGSTYVFTMILGQFLIGIAIGAVVFGLISRRLRSPIGLLAASQIAVALLAIWGLVFIISRPTGVDAFNALGTLRALSGAVILVVLPATIVMGLAFPASSALLEDREGHVATATGRLLAANTLGAISGTFLIPFFVIPAIGSPMAVVLLALVNVATGIALAVARLQRPVVRLGIAGAGVAAALVLVVATSIPGAIVDPTEARIRAIGGQVQRASEDEIASVRAGRALGGQQLWVAGTSMTLLTVDAKLMPILPLMLRPDSESALVVAFGMGSSFRAALIAGLEVEAVELVPSVPTMFGVFYPDAEQVLANPRGRVIVADGRNHVELTDRRYDIIITDPPPPIESSGVSVIASRDYYAEGLDRLNAGGVMMQWVPYGQTLDEFKAHIRTFHDVYPHVIVAFGPGGYGFFMLGSQEPLNFDDAAMRSVLRRPGVLEDISSAYDSPETTEDGWIAKIRSILWLSGPGVAEFAGPGPLITDDRPLPEYFFLRRTYGPRSPQLRPELLRDTAGG